MWYMLSARAQSGPQKKKGQKEFVMSILKFVQGFDSDYVLHIYDKLRY